MVCNFLTKNIDVNEDLRKYRNDLKTRYPDPQKRDNSELADKEAAAKGKKDAKKDAPAKKKDEKKKDPAVDQTIDTQPEAEEDGASPSAEDSDSVIDDEEDENFTNDLRYMRGAPMSEELKKVLVEKSFNGVIPKDAEFIDNLAATKTAHQSDAVLREFEQKKKTIMLINSSFGKTKEYRAHTKGKFADSVADNAGKLYRTDLGWKKKANPTYNQAEINFYARDLELMAKRRYQKVVQAIQLEEEYGLKGVTKMPEMLKKMSKSPKKK